MSAEEFMRQSSNAFFRPTRAFTSWLISYADGRRIVDCGAGIGLVEHSLRRRGCQNVLSIDTMERFQPMSSVQMADATCFPFRRDDLAVLCRPCHDVWIENTVINANRCGAEALYIGLERNVRQDLPGEFIGPGTRHTVKAGKEGEIILGFYSPVPAPVPAPGEVLVSLPFWDEPQAVKDGGDRWIHADGTWFNKGGEATVHGTADSASPLGIRA